jgi:UDP-N-acetylmuramate dehydrogenase
MIKIEKNHPLAQYTTLKIGLTAEYFVVVKNKADLLEAIEFANKNKKNISVLGGGSNVLLSGKVKGLLVKNEIKGISITQKK